MNIIAFLKEQRAQTEEKQCVDDDTTMLDSCQEEYQHIVPEQRKKKKFVIKGKSNSKAFIQKTVNELDMFNDMSKIYCCEKNCIQIFSFEEIKSWRVICHSKDRDSRHSFLKALMIKENGETTKFNIGGIRVCQVCFSKVLGISKKQIYSRGSNMDRIVDFPVKTKILKFLDDLEAKNQFQPDKREVHVSYTSYRQCYNEFYEECLNEGEQTIGSYKYFHHVWKKQRPNLKLRKRMRFAQCSFCVNIQEDIKNNNNKTSKEKLEKELKDHIQQQYSDRNIYALTKMKASKYRKSCLSIAIDGSDMSCYGLPYFCTKTKETEKGFKIPIKLTGIIVHGWGYSIYTFPCNIPTGANLTIECIHRTIEVMKEKYSNVLNCPLPDVLFIQVMNKFDVLDGQLLEREQK
jgi:hypothetical protein